MAGTPRTDAETQAMIAEFDATTGIERVPANAKTASIAPVIEQRNVQPMDFVALHADMKRFQTRTVVMTFKQVYDYVGIAEETYIKDEKDKVSLDQRWQRKLEKKRVTEAAEYLKATVRFFPAIVCVPSSTEACKFSNGSVNLAGIASILALDGQHRTAAIHTVMESDSAEEWENECVTVLILDLHDMKTRRQIFADINRSAKKVSKTLNLFFDTSDHAAEVAKEIINHQIMTTDNKGREYPRFPYRELVDMERPTPLGKSHNLMSLTNMYNLVGPMTKVIDDSGNAVLADEQIIEVATEVIEALPDVGLLRQAARTFDDFHKEYVFTNSTLWQAIGLLLAERLNAMTSDGKERKYHSDTFAKVVGKWIENLTSNDKWSISDGAWSQKGREVVVKGSVGTQRGYIKAATDVLRDLTA